jgi:hypothetical protein
MYVCLAKVLLVIIVGEAYMWGTFAKCEASKVANVPHM